MPSGVSASPQGLWWPDSRGPLGSPPEAQLWGGTASKGSWEPVQAAEPPRGGPLGLDAALEGRAGQTAGPRAPLTFFGSGDGVLSQAHTHTCTLRTLLKPPH